MVEIAHSTGTEFIARLAELSCGKTAPCDTRLYGDPFTLLELSSLRIGGARQVERLFDSGTAICGAGVNNKDRTGDLMTCATPLDGMSGNRGREKPIFDFCAKSLVKRECASVGFALLSLSLHQRGPSISGVSLRMGLYNRSCAILRRSWGLPRNLHRARYGRGLLRVQINWARPERIANGPDTGTRASLCQTAMVRRFAHLIYGPERNCRSRTCGVATATRFLNWVDFPQSNTGA